MRGDQLSLWKYALALHDTRAEYRRQTAACCCNDRQQVRSDGERGSRAGERPGTVRVTLIAVECRHIVSTGAEYRRTGLHAIDPYLDRRDRHGKRISRPAAHEQRIQVRDLRAEI